MATVSKEEDLRELITFSRDQGMEPLVEVVSDEEFDVAVAAGARLIGVNNRDLRTFKVDMTRTDRICRAVSERGLLNSVHVLALSGINSPCDVRQ